jgi:hypothetical protein
MNVPLTLTGTGSASVTTGLTLATVTRVMRLPASPKLSVTSTTTSNVPLSVNVWLRSKVLSARSVRGCLPEPSP